MLIQHLTKYGFSKAFLEERLKKDSSHDLGEVWMLRNRFDHPFVIFSSNFEDNQDLFIDDLKRTYPMVGLVAAYNDSGIDKVIQRNFLDDSFSYFNELGRPNKIETQKSLLFGDASKGYKPLKILDRSIENIFFDAHSIVRDIDGLHADQALDELCKFLYVKLYDEESIGDKDLLHLQRGLYVSNEELASVVRSLYNLSKEYDERVYSLRIPKYKKSRGVFDANIKLSAPALAKLVGVFEAINLTDSNIDVKGRAFQKMLLPAMRAGMGQYFTPQPVIEFIVEVLVPKVDELVIDPFTGSGHFLSSTLQYVIGDENNNSEKKLHEFKFHKLHGIEKSERMVRISMTDMRLHGDGHSNIRCTDALLSFDNYEDLKEDSFDIVMSNPPFGSLLTSEAIERLGSFQLMKKRKTLPLEVLGLERCIQLLRPGGRFGIVLPESIISNKNMKFVRDWLMQNTKLIGIVSLPLETFSPFGANIKTIILFGIKKNVGQAKQSTNNVLVGKIESVGYDFKGHDKTDCDIDELIEPLKSVIEKV